jgi:hypothetical protein
VSTEHQLLSDQLAHAIDLLTLLTSAKIAKLGSLLIQELVNASELKVAVHNKTKFKEEERTATDVSIKHQLLLDQIAHAIDLLTLLTNAKIAKSDSLLIQELVNASELKVANKTTF